MNVLNKSVCRKCAIDSIIKGKKVDTKENPDARRLLTCAFEIDWIRNQKQNKEFCTKMKADVKDSPPEGCPYVLEHLLIKSDNDRMEVTQEDLVKLLEWAESLSYKPHRDKRIELVKKYIEMFNEV